MAACAGPSSRSGASSVGGSWVPPFRFVGKKIERKHLQPNGLLFATLPCGFGTRLPGFYAPLPCGFLFRSPPVSVDRLPKMAMPGRNAGISAQWAGIGEGLPGPSYLVSPAESFVRLFLSRLPAPSWLRNGSTEADARWRGVTPRTGDVCACFLRRRAPSPRLVRLQVLRRRCFIWWPSCLRTTRTCWRIRPLGRPRCRRSEQRPYSLSVATKQRLFSTTASHSTSSCARSMGHGSS